MSSRCQFVVSAMRAAASISIRELTMRPIRPVNAGDGLLRIDSSVVSWQQSGAAARCNGRIWARAIYSNGTMAQSELVIRGIYFTQVNAICCAAVPAPRGFDWIAVRKCQLSAGLLSDV